METKNLNDTELILLYSASIKELRRRNIIRTKNVLGELGEYLAIHYYNKTPKMPKLQAAPIGTKNVDAISRNGERYSIKSCSAATTGVFYGLQPKNSILPDKQQFEYVIICKFDDDCQLQAIYEIDWDTFLKHKNWHATMQAWNIRLTKELISDSKIIYQKED